MTEQINLPVPIETHGPLKQINDILEKKGNEILDWSGLYTVYRFFYIYLFKKYKHNCRLYSDRFLGIDLGERFDDNLKYKLIKHAQQFKKCYDKGSDMIIIPLRYDTSPTSGHANFLLFKREPNIIERFEPYGQQIIEHSFIDYSIKYLVNEINKLISRPIRYTLIEESCHQIGIQHREERIEAQPKEIKEGGGYCAIWSMFFTELSLANPSLNLKQLTDIIYSINTPGLYMRDIARGYVYFFYEKMSKYFSQYLSPIMTFQKYIKNINPKTSIMKKHINDATNVLDELFNIEMELYNDPNLTIEELKQTTSNSIKILNEHYKLASNIIQKKIRKQITKNYIKQDILSKMISNKANLDKFTPIPIIKEQPKVLVMDVRNSIISKIATPLVSTSSKIKLKEKIKPPCKPGKERNANGRCVKIQSYKKTKILAMKPKTVKIKPPCKPGKERNANGRCVKIKGSQLVKSVKNIQVEQIVLPNELPSLSNTISNMRNISIFPKNITKIKPPCKPGKERNANGRCVKIQTNKSKKIKSKTLKNKPPCKPGKERNANGRCVKIKNI